MKFIKICIIICLVFLPSCTYKYSREKLMLARKYADMATRDIINGNYEQAKAGFDLSLEIAPVPEGYDGLGCIAFYKKDYELAEEYFIKAFNEDNGYLRALSNLALLYDVLGLKDESKNIYEFIIEKRPEDYRFRNNFAGLLYDIDNEGKKKAKEELRKAVSLKKDDIIINNLKKIESLDNKSQIAVQVGKNLNMTNNLKKNETIIDNKYPKNDKEISKVGIGDNDSDSKNTEANQIDIDSFKF